MEELLLEDENESAETVEPPTTEQDIESTETDEQETLEPVDFSFSESDTPPQNTEQEEALQEPESEHETDRIDSESEEAIMGEEASLYSATTGNLMFFNLSSPDYTVRMNTQVAVTYAQNGNGAVVTGYIKNLGWHYASPNKNHTIYCIEPNKNFGESTSLNAKDEGVTLTGSAGTYGEGVWYALPLERRQAIGLILLYSNARWNHSVDAATTAKNSNPNLPLRVATQFLIYEIVTGLRDAGTFNRLASNGYTAGDVFYNAGVNNVSGFADHYVALENSIQGHLKIPSFTSRDPNNAPLITLTGNETTVTDTNGVLPNFSVADGNGAVFQKSGNNLTICQSGSISESTVFACSRNLFSPEASTYSLWYSPYLSKYQTCISLYGEVRGDMQSYFRIKAETKGAIRMIKTTNTGENLSGWKFDVFQDPNCSNLYGTYTTGNDGQVTVSDVSVGTYYVREQVADDYYWVCDTAVKPVSVASNQTADVAFHNMHYGNIGIEKKLLTDGSLEGWQFRVTDAQGVEVPGSPFTTDVSGNITTGNLLPGEYTVEELVPENSLFVCQSENPQKVAVTAGATAKVGFINALRPGEIVVEKVNAAGEHLKEATFLMEWSRDGTTWTPVHYANQENVVPGGCSNPNVVDGCLTTDETGVLTWGNLYPGIQYRVTEVKSPNGYSKLIDPAFCGVLPVDTLKTQLRVVNCEIFTLPQTGSFGTMLVSVGQFVSGTLSVGLWMSLKRKEE